jgi:MFS family permease
MTIPLGFVAERYGRRALLWLNLVPRVFMLAWVVIVGYFDQIFPTRAIAAGPALSFLGGDCVFNSITYSLAAGITDDYVLRASYFGYMSSITYVVNLLGPALASASMTLLLWLPFWIGITLLAIAIPVISMLPDHNTAKNQRDEQSQPLLSSPLLKAQDSRPTILHSVINRFHALRTALASHPRNFSLLLACFLLASLASSDTKLLVQYISKRYRWTFASAGYLLSGKAVVNFVLLTVVVPRVLRSAVVAGGGSRPPGASSDRINFRFAKLCFGVSILGAAAIAVSTTIWVLVPALLVYALGSALPIFTLSLLKSPAICSSGADDIENGDRESSSPNADAETHIFSIVMLVKTLGSLLGAPLMAFLWVRGIGLGGAALGMPYFVSAGCYAAAIFIFCRIEIHE